MPFDPRTRMTTPYFAYGSNLCIARLRSRVSGVSFLELASLHAHELRWHKRSVDGSGKLSVIPSSASIVRGALFTMPVEDVPLLDEVEGLGLGYDRRSVVVRTADGEAGAWTYVARATHIDDALRPYSWYRDLVACGARALGLPDSYVESLRAVEADDDLDPVRDEKQRAYLPCR
jgi:AIG2-like family